MLPLRSAIMPRYVWASSLFGSSSSARLKELFAASISSRSSAATPFSISAATCSRRWEKTFVSAARVAALPNGQASIMAAVMTQKRRSGICKQFTPRDESVAPSVTLEKQAARGKSCLTLPAPFFTKHAPKRLSLRRAGYFLVHRRWDHPRCLRNQTLLSDLDYLDQSSGSLSLVQSNAGD